MQGRDGGAPADRLAVTGEDEVRAVRLRRRLPVEVHEPDGLLPAATARTGDPGPGDRDVPPQPTPRPGGHGLCGRGRALPVRPEETGWHVELPGLDVVR